MRMATLKSKKLQEALKKARKIGRAEEPVTIDGCALVLQNLPPADYEAVIAEAEAFENIEYFHAYQMGFVCRSIIEIEGVDLRDVDFIEDDVPAGQYLLSGTCSKNKAAEAKEALKSLGIELTVVPPDGSEGERTVMVERHEWVRQRASKWGREAIAVLYRKYSDVVTEGERKSREGIEFKTEDETSEDKFRRLLSEIKELEAQLPVEVSKKALEDNGYLPKSTPEELEAIAQRARDFAIEQAKLKQDVVQAADPEPEPEAPPAPVRPVVVTPPPAPPPPLSLPEEVVAPPPTDIQQELMERLRNRQPLNRTPMQPPVPMAPAQRSAVPNPLQQARAVQIAAIEGPMDVGETPPQSPVAYQVQGGTPELSHRLQNVDGKGVNAIMDKPPVAGINPRFRPIR
jgi:hypothetical protein